ncbi:STY1053 family phage-associated protein [Burkholderia sp. YIM B11467]
MTKLHVHTAFTLRHDDGSTEQFGIGEHSFPAATAAHWYVKHHTREPGAQEGIERVDADGGSAEREAALRVAEEFLRGEKAALDARLADLDKRAAELDALGASLAERERELDARVTAFEEAQRAAGRDKGDAAQQSAGGNQSKQQSGKR